MTSLDTILMPYRKCERMNKPKRTDLTVFTIKNALLQVLPRERTYFMAKKYDMLAESIHAQIQSLGKTIDGFYLYYGTSEHEDFETYGMDDIHLSSRRPGMDVADMDYEMLKTIIIDDGGVPSHIPAPKLGMMMTISVEEHTANGPTRNLMPGSFQYVAPVWDNTFFTVTLTHYRHHSSIMEPDGVKDKEFTANFVHIYVPNVMASELTLDGEWE